MGVIKTVRLYLDIATTFKEKIVRMKEKTGAPSLTAVLIKALEVYAQIMQAQKDGSKIYRRKAKNDEESPNECEILIL